MACWKRWESILSNTDVYCEPHQLPKKRIIGGVSIYDTCGRKIIQIRFSKGRGRMLNECTPCLKTDLVDDFQRLAKLGLMFFVLLLLAVAQNTLTIFQTTNVIQKQNKKWKQICKLVDHA